MIPVDLARKGDCIYCIKYEALYSNFTEANDFLSLYFHGEVN